MLRGSTKVYTSSYYEEFQGILTVLKHRLFMFLDEWQARYLTDNIEYIDIGIDDDEQRPRGRPQGSKNKQKRFTLDDNTLSVFAAGKAATQGLS
ncbi:Uncharacterised protein [Escherichia coli]|uniref:Uncharacterized protein n=1 Tax=Escherichia coli TaxID=562 RepID=A0A377B2K4_ECOLX|nr:Uncharacterised protein [Escherichia coli]